MSDTAPPVAPDAPLAVPSAGDDHLAQPSTAPAGRWCPYCGADLSGVPERQNPDEAVFAVAGRRLKIAIALVLVAVWLVTSIYDWYEDPATVLLPGWWSALGVVLLAYLLGVTPWGLLRRR